MNKSAKAIFSSMFVTTTYFGTCCHLLFFAMPKETKISKSSLSGENGLVVSFEKTAQQMELNMEMASHDHNMMMEKAMDDFLAQLSYISEAKFKSVSSIIKEQIER